MSRWERAFWVMIAAGCIAAPLLASILEVGPFIISDDDGATQVVLGTAGQVQARSIRALAAQDDLVFEDTDGTDRAGISRNLGTLFFLNTDNISTNSLPATYSERNSVTFGTADTDASYDILITTYGLTGTANSIPLSVGDRYAESFEIINPGHGPDVSYTWLKIRRAAPNGTP